MNMAEVQAYHGYFKNGRFMPFETVATVTIPDEVEVYITVTKKSISPILQTEAKTKSQPFEISKSNAKTPKLGGWEGRISMSDDFNEPMEEFKEYMQ
jgi:hypothetical protein